MTMKRFLLSVLAGVTAVLMLAGCGQQPSSGNQSSQSQAPAAAPSESEAPAPEAPSPSESIPAPAADWQEGRRFGERLDEAAVTQWVNGLDLGTDASAPDAPADAAAAGTNALVVYFSVPEDVDTAGVDAVAGASVLVSNGTALGNMEYMAGVIQRETGADSYRIVEQNTYPRIHQPLIDQAQQEQRNNDRPAIAGELPDLSAYDVIYLGYPNWWGDMPMILYTFLDSVDLSGKTIVPFNVHNGSRFSGTIGTIKELEPNATVVEDGFTVSERSVAEAGADVAKWVAELGYAK